MNKTVIITDCARHLLIRVVTFGRNTTKLASCVLDYLLQGILKYDFDLLNS